MPAERGVCVAAPLAMLAVMAKKKAKKRTTKKTPAAGTLADNLHKTQAAMREELDRVIARIEDLRRDEATSKDELYEEVAYALFGEHPLFYARFKSEAEYLKAVLPNAKPRTDLRAVPRHADSAFRMSLSLEWGARFRHAIGARGLEIRLSMGAGEHDRRA